MHLKPAEKGETMDATDLEIVVRSGLFRALDAGAVAEFVADARPESFPKGAALFEQGEAVGAIHLVIAGWVKLCRTADDDVSTVVSVNGVGETFGEAAALLGGPAPAGARAATDVRILRLPAEGLRRRLVDDVDLAFRMLASASMQLRLMVQELQRLKSQPAASRIAGFLADLAGAERGRIELDFPYEKTLIAARLGMTPESFSRGLAKLREHGVAVEREHVTVARIERLRTLAGCFCS